MGAAIEFEFKGNLAQLRRDLNEAARLAKASANETSRQTDAGVAGLFRRTPERRAERAIAGLGTSLATGDIALGLAAFSEKLTGLGLAAGVGVGVAVGVFQKFHQEINETAKAFDALRADFSKSFALEAGLGPEALTNLIEGGNKKLEAAAEKREGIWNKMVEFFGRGTIPAGSADVRFGGTAPDRKPTLAEEHEKNTTEELDRQAKRTAERADKELKIANIKLLAVTSSQKEAEFAKIALDAEEKRSALQLNRAADDSLWKSLLAVNVEEEAARRQVEKKFPAAAAAAAPPDNSRVNVAGHTLHEILQSGLEPVIDTDASGRQIQNWRWPSSPGASAPQGLQIPMLPPGWDYNAGTGEMIMDKMGFKRTQTMPGYGGLGGDPEIGTGIAGIKSGIDDLNTKMGQMLQAW